jgi:hypothetical protein
LTDEGEGRQRAGSDLPLRTDETTSVMTPTDSVAGPASSSSPMWVDSTVRWTRLVNSPASSSWASTQPFIPVLLSEAVSTAIGRSPSVLSAWA